MAIKANTLRRLFIRHLSLCQRAESLIDLGERALARRDAGALRTVGARLFDLSEGGALIDASAYYTAMALNSSRQDRAQAEGILQGIAETGSALFRAKALLALGFNTYLSDAASAQEYYKAAEKINPDDEIVSLTIQSQKAVMASIAGDHRRALADFQRIETLAVRIGQRIPLYRDSVYNSLAVEYGATGDLDSAEGYARMAVESEDARPEWNETLDEVTTMRLTRSKESQKSESRRRGAARRRIDRALEPMNADQLETVAGYLERGEFKVKR